MGLVVIIILTGFIGDIAWFIAGRPRKPRPNRGGRGRIIPPDDDPDFLRKL